MTISWGKKGSTPASEAKGIAEWRKQRDNFLLGAKSASRKIDYSIMAGPFDGTKYTNVGRRKYFVQSLRVCAGFESNVDKEAYCEAIFPMDYGPYAGNRSLAAGGCPGSSSCGTYIRSTWQMLGAGDWTQTKDKIDRGLRGSYSSNTVMSQIAHWAAETGALHGSYDGASGTPITKDDPDNWQEGDVVFVWQQFAEPKGNDTGKHHIFTIDTIARSDPKEADKAAPDRSPVTSGTSWQMVSIDGGSAATNASNPCEGIQMRPRTLKYGTATVDGKPYPNSLYTEISGIWGTGIVSYWIDFSLVLFTDPEVFLRWTPSGPP